MSKVLIVLMALFVLTLGGCALFEGSEVVITTPGNVIDGAETVPVDITALPASWVDKLPKDANGDTIDLVYVGKDQLKDPTVPYIPVLDTPEGFAQAAGNAGLLEGIFSAVMGVGKTFVPGLAALEGLGLLFFKRKRMHYANAARAVVPNDGKVDIGAALASFGKALGMAHSSEDSKFAAEDPLGSKVA